MNASEREEIYAAVHPDSGPMIPREDNFALDPVDSTALAQQTDTYAHRKAVDEQRSMKAAYERCHNGTLSIINFADF